MQTVEISNLKLQSDSSVRAYGADSVGCKDTESDVMLSLGGAKPLLVLDADNKVVGEGRQLGVVDVFMTRHQAEYLFEELAEILGAEFKLK